MNNIINSILDLPETVNQKVMSARINSEIDQFDSKDGIRKHVATLYNWFSFLVFLSIEWVVINGALDYFQSDATALSKVGSVITSILLIYSAFPIARIIRNHGTALGNSHDGMVNFIFKDFVMANIRIAGESAAVAGVISAIGLTLSWLIDHDLYAAASTGILGTVSNGFIELPMAGLNALLAALQLNVLGEAINSVMSFRLDAGTHFGGDFIWYRSDVITVVGAYVGVMMGLIYMYVNLTIYNYLYTMISNFAGWLQSPSIPIKNK